MTPCLCTFSWQRQGKTLGLKSVALQFFSRFLLQKEPSAFFYIILKMLENSFSISLEEWCFCAFLMVESCSCWWCGFYFSLTQLSIALKPPCLPTILDLKLSYGVFLRGLFIFSFFLFLPSIFLLVESLLFFRSTEGWCIVCNRNWLNGLLPKPEVVGRERGRRRGGRESHLSFLRQG